MTPDRQWLERAQHDLDDARFLLDGERFGTAMVTAYFACLSAVLALSARHGILLLRNSKVHRMADVKLRHERALLNEEDIATLTRLRARRDDYHYNLLVVERELAAQSIDLAQHFIERVKALL